jgi:hypothetical protein
MDAIYQADLDLANYPRLTAAPGAEDDSIDWSAIPDLNMEYNDSSDDESTVTSQGKPTSLMQPQPLAEVHPFVETLHDWQDGIQVDCGEDWEWDVVETAVERGPHPTANTEQSWQLFADDIVYQQKAGFSKVMLWEDLKKLRPKNLKISPVAVIPQIDRRGRIILDLSFPVWKIIDGIATMIQQSVNDSTVVQSPDTPVKEIGKVLPRLLEYFRDVPEGVWILLSKLDISDGFWRLIVRGNDCYNFAYVLPQPPGEPTRIVVPSAVQMGWVESPGNFCAVTETARDLTEYHVRNETPLPKHPIEEKMTVVHVPERAREKVPSRLLQCYVDDFCNAATQSKDGTHIPAISRAAIHSIHSVFPPTEVTGHKDGKPPLSVKKLDKGEGNWEVVKEKVGFIFDGRRRTVRLPKAKAKRYIEETKKLICKRRKKVPIKAFQTVVGKLRHASVILPAAAGFFTPINRALRTDKDGNQPRHIGLGEKSEVTEALSDIVVLIKLLSRRPTHVREILAGVPSYAAFHDAAAEGGGGVWFSLKYAMVPLLWRLPHPDDIRDSVISFDNPSGSITNSDLELAAEVAAVAVILRYAP